jgi:hypothetical protein
MTVKRIGVMVEFSTTVRGSTPANFKHASSLDYLAMICCNQAFRVALTVWVKLR